MSAEEGNVTVQPTATESSNNEPIVDPEKVEKVVEAVAELLGVGIGAKIYLVCALIILALTVIATPITWFYKRDPKAQTAMYISLWKSQTRLSDSTWYNVDAKDFDCKDLRQRFQAAEAFAIISIVAALLSVIIAFINVKLLSQLKVPVLALNGFTLVATLITWTIMVNVYVTTWCDQRSYWDDNYQLWAGTGLFVTSWVLTVVGAIALVVDPAPFKGDRLIRLTINWQLISFLVTFVFALAGTAQTVWFDLIFGRTGDANYGRTRFFMWSYIQTNPSNQDTTYYYRNLKNCDDFQEAWFFVQAFGVLSTVFALFALLVAVINFARSSKPFARTVLILGFLASVFMLATWGMATKIYFGRWCNSSFYFNGQDYRMNAGYALFVTGWVVSAVATVFALFVYIRTHNSPFKDIPTSALVFLVVMFTALIFTIVGAAYTWYIKEIGSSKTEVSLWQITTTTTATQTETSIKDIACKTLRQRLQAIQAFALLSCIFTGLATLLAGARLKLASLRVPSAVVAIIASLFQLIAWAIGGNLYYQGYCDMQSYDSQNYAFAAGFGLYVAAWCITLTTGVINLIIA